MTYTEGLASLAFRAKWARGFLWVFIGVTVLGIPLSYAVQYAYYESDLPTQALTIAAAALGIVSLISMIGCVVAIPAWTYRAWANLRVLGLRGLGYSPGWAAGSFFVPIAGLFVPFLAMRQLFNRSTGEDEDRANASAPDVTSWWACYVAGLFVTSFLVLTALFNMNGLVFIVTPEIMTQALSVFANLLLIGAAWFLIRTIRDITDAQSSSAGISETFA